MDAQITRRRFAALSGAAAMTLMARDIAAQDATPMATPVASPIGALRIRKNAKDLSAGEKKAFTDAILALKQKPSPWTDGVSTYDQFVLWHRDAFECDLMAAHMGPAFFPWHRMYLHLFRGAASRDRSDGDPAVLGLDGGPGDRLLPVAG